MTIILFIYASGDRFSVMSTPRLIFLIGTLCFLAIDMFSSATYCCLSRPCSFQWSPSLYVLFINSMGSSTGLSGTTLVTDARTDASSCTVILPTVSNIFFIQRNAFFLSPVNIYCKFVTWMIVYYFL
ncbi:hypothetical protein OTU49_011096 [Cherax quadricarinatus]|uniref:Uncharacterized protein n=1 Tax=Cherax quadricarinatus TaxID=27406 RepID=A0AAW0W735_CHEQU